MFLKNVSVLGEADLKYERSLRFSKYNHNSLLAKHLKMQFITTENRRRQETGEKRTPCGGGQLLTAILLTRAQWTQVKSSALLFGMG